VRVRVNARDDARREDPQTAVIKYTCDATRTPSAVSTTDHQPGATYQFPNLRSGPGLTAVTVIDNETAGAVIRESGVGTLVYLCGNATCTIPGQKDDYWLRLTKRPENPNDLDHNPATMVQIAVLTDGLVDVYSIVDGFNVTHVIDYSLATDTDYFKKIGGYVPSRLFLGNLTFGIDSDGHLTLTRANGST
jgi:hypothetical protein